jgi:hypothetical protein
MQLFFPGLRSDTFWTGWYSLEKLEDTGGLQDEKRKFWKYFCDRSTSGHLADWSNTGKSKIWHKQKILIRIIVLSESFLRQLTAALSVFDGILWLMGSKLVVLITWK